MKTLILCGALVLGFAASAAEPPKSDKPAEQSARKRCDPALFHTVRNLAELGCKPPRPPKAPPPPPVPPLKAPEPPEPPLPPAPPEPDF